MAGTYPNGRIPTSALIQFNSGVTRHPNGLVEEWFWALTPGTYAKHLALVSLAKRNTGRTLSPSQGFSCYRNLYGQTIAKQLYGKGAADIGTSSHGGYWEKRDTLAIDYGNWESVYSGNRARFYADVRAVGLTPGMISPQRGYPDEPWHVIDFEPYRAVPAGGGSTPFPNPTEKNSGDSDMYAMRVFPADAQRPPIAVGPQGTTLLETDEFDNFYGGIKYDGINARQYDLNLAVARRLFVVPPAEFLGKGESQERPWTLFSPGYFKVLTAEEFDNQPFATRRLEGNDRQYDLWVSEAVHGAGAPFPVAVPDLDYGKLVGMIVDALPQGSESPTAAEIATAVRELFRNDPLK